MTEKLFQGDICDLLEETAISIVSEADQESIQVASCPRAHACVQGLVERRFHPIHLRDFYSVINYLLLRLHLLEERSEEEREVSKLKKQLTELQRKNRDRKSKYEEVCQLRVCVLAQC